MMATSKVIHTSVQRVNRENPVRQDDLLAVEEPLEIRLKYALEEGMVEKSVAVTMRTPGNDLELVTGFLFSENIITSGADIKKIYHCPQVRSEEERGNVVIVLLAPGVVPEPQKLNRHFYTSSSCGVCGKSSIEALNFRVDRDSTPPSWKIRQSLIYSLPQTLQKHQLVFEYTGGLHAAALFDLEGALILLREDIGRHNALDKITGAALSQGLIPAKNHILVVSGRLGFELVQKAVVAGIQMIVAIGAPSSLAVNTAEAYGVTLVGFVKKGRFNIYTGKDRIDI